MPMAQKLLPYITHDPAIRTLVRTCQIMDKKEGIKYVDDIFLLFLLSVNYQIAL